MTPFGATSLADAPPKPSATGTPDTRERILDAAEALFAVQGLAGTAVRDIAREVGLTPASLYNHFAGKQAIYDAVLERGVMPLLHLMRELPSRDHTARDMEETINAIMAQLASRPHFPRLIQHEVITGGPYLGKLARNWFRPILEQGIAELKRDSDNGWQEDEYDLVMSAWLNMVFGHFAMAPMMAEVFDDDPLSEKNLERQTRFLRKLARLMLAGRSLISRDPENA
jgi:AcrR family transcriptional regulator